MSQPNKSKRTIRSAMSGKIINGGECILTSEALDYVKKMGYQVTKNQDRKEIDIVNDLIIRITKGDRITNENR